MAVPAEFLQAGKPHVNHISFLHWNSEVALEERSEPFDWLELNVVLYSLALARHPKAPAFIEYVFGMEDSDFVEVASRALLAWHGLPDLFLIWVDELDSLRFDEMPTAAQDYIRGVDLSGTWQRSGISIYFEEATPEKLRLMSLAFVRMGMPWSARRLMRPQSGGNKWKACMP